MSKALSFQSVASVVLAVGKGNKHSKADSDEIKEMDGKDEGDSTRNNAKTENETRAPSRSVEPTSYLSGEATRLWVDRGVVGVPIKRGMTSTTPQPFDLGPRQSFQDLSQEMARRAHSRKELSSELASRQSSSEDRPRTGMSMRTGRVQVQVQVQVGVHDQNRDQTRDQARVQVNKEGKFPGS